MCNTEQQQQADVGGPWLALSSFVILGSGPESSSFPFFFAKPAVCAEGGKRFACFCCQWSLKVKPLSIKRLETRPISDYTVNTQDVCWTSHSARTVTLSFTALQVTDLLMLRCANAAHTRIIVARRLYTFSDGYQLSRKAVSKSLCAQRLPSISKRDYESGDSSRKPSRRVLMA